MFYKNYYVDFNHNNNYKNYCNYNNGNNFIYKSPFEINIPKYFTVKTSKLKEEQIIKATVRNNKN